MIRKLFTQRLLSLCMLGIVAGSFNAHSQTIPIATPSPSVAYTYPFSTQGVSDFLTFEVQNDNPCPIALTDLSMFHAGLVRNVTFPPSTIQRNVSTNNATYELYGSFTRLVGSPFPMSNGWTKIATVDSISTDTLNQITPIFNGLSVTIPANTRMRFLVRATDSIIVPLNTNPLSTTVNNITFIHGSATNLYSGYFTPQVAVNPSNFGVGSGIQTLNFEGRLSFEILAPDRPVANTNLKPATRCIGQDVTLTATAPAGGIFTWRNSAGTIIAQNGTGTHQITNLQLSDAGRYYVTYTNCGKESLPDSVTIIINDPPAPTVSGKFDYCLNEQFEATTVNGTNVKWYYDPTGGSPVPVTPTINTSSPNTLVYYVTQTDAFGCESSQRTMVRYRAAPKPTRPIVNTPVYYCELEEADQLSAVGDTLRWYYFPVGGVPTVEAPTPNTSVNDSLQYYVTQTIDGCESNRSRIDVVVVFRPNGMILLDKDYICAGDSIELNYYGSAFDGAQFNWVLPPVGTTILNGGFDQGPLGLRLDSAGKYQVKLTVGFTGCLSEQYTEDVFVKPLPFGNISVKQDVCLGQPELVENINYTSMLDTFIWDFDGGKTTHFTTDQGPYGVYWETPGEKAIKVTYIHNECTVTDIDTITVHPKPNATIVAEGYNVGDEICASDSLKVTVQAIEPGASYKWTPTRFFDTYADAAVTYARVDFKSKIYVEVEDIYGCQNKDSLEVLTKSCCEMVFPSAFSPNNDGKNDLFRPITLGRREVETFRVVNRFGQTVYESRQSSLGWDGTMNGKPADVGTYFYLISFMCEKEKVDQSGEVILVR